MEWLNIHTSTLDSEDYQDAPWEERCAWVELLRYCAGQENGGRIVGAKTWAESKVLRMLRVPADWLKKTARLFVFEGDDLLVKFYPIEQELAIRASRAGGRAGGLKRAENAKAKNTPPSTPPSAPPSRGASTPPSAPPSTEGKGREGKVMEGNTPPAREDLGFIIPTDAEVLAFAAAFAEPAIGASSMPVPWALDWLANQLKNPARFPADWQRVITLNFRADFQNRHPKALGAKKNAPGGGAQKAFQHEIQSPTKVKRLQL